VGKGDIDSGGEGRVGGEAAEVVEGFVVEAVEDDEVGVAEVGEVAGEGPVLESDGVSAGKAGGGHVDGDGGLVATGVQLN
jgi:hypothetical protein